MEKEKVKNITNIKEENLTKEQIKEKVLTLLSELNEKKRERKEEELATEQVNEISDNYNKPISEEEKRYNHELKPTKQPLKDMGKIFRRIQEILQQNPELQNDQEIAKALKVADYKEIENLNGIVRNFEPNKIVNNYLSEKEGVVCKVLDNDIITNDETATINNFITLMQDDIESNDKMEIALKIIPTNEQGIKNIADKMEENPNFKDKILKQIDPEWKENIGETEDKEEILFLLNEEYGQTNKKNR